MKQQFQWFVVVGYGLCGKVTKNPFQAWNSFFTQGVRQYGYERCSDNETARNAHSPTLCMATTKLAAKDANVSTHFGIVKNGKWRRVCPIDDYDYLMRTYDFAP